MVLTRLMMDKIHEFVQTNRQPIYKSLKELTDEAELGDSN